MKFLLWLRGIVGNGPYVTGMIILFIIILCLALWRPAHAAELDLRLGASLKAHDTGPVLGLNALFPQGDFDVYAGTLLWGATPTTPNNWSWETGIHGCRWALCASIGATYLQRVDRFNGSHTNFNIELSYLLGGERFRSIDLTHLSNAGTVAPNPGRNAALLNIRLQ